MAAINEVNFNGREAKDDCLCSNQASNLASLYNGDCDAESVANVLRSNIGPWDWPPVPIEPIFKPYTTANEFMEGESMDEVIKRIVHEVLKELTKEGNAVISPEIKKYHIKHK